MSCILKFTRNKLSFPTHSVHRTSIKVFQRSIIKQPTRGRTWDQVIRNFTMTYVPAEHRQNTGYIFLEKYICILSKNSLHSRINKVYTTEIHSSTFFGLVT